MLGRRGGENHARLIGVSRPIRIVTIAALGVAALGVVPPAHARTHTAAAPHTLITYPLPPKATPEQLGSGARAKLPAVTERAMVILNDEMDQDSLMPVQQVSALQIRRAFRGKFGNAAYRSALRISWRESRLLPNVVNNRNTNGTKDWGLFQLNDGGTLQYVGGEPGTDALRTRWNARAAAKLLASEGWGPWGGML